MATRKKASKKAASAATKPAEVKAPDESNIIWADRDKEPPEDVRIGMTRIALPDADEQRAGFHSEHAARLIRQIPGFKALKSKGR